MSEEDHRELADAWVRWKTGVEADTLASREMSRTESQSEQLRAEFSQLVRDATGNSTQALEFLRQLTICSRTVLRANLLIIIQAADMLLPAGDGDGPTA